MSRIHLASDPAGLAPSLVAAIEGAGGLWWASDAYTTAEEVVAAARAHGVSALRLDFRDLSLLFDLPSIRYLHVRTDARPKLDPVAALTGLRGLIVYVGALRGRIDLAAFPDLRWLRIPLGGKGGAEMLGVLGNGHSRLEWLSVREVEARSVADVCHSFPRLRVLRIGFADRLRQLGALAQGTPGLRKIALEFTQIRDLEGLADLQALETVEFFGGRVRNLEPVAALSRLRYARLDLPDLDSIEPLRGHPSLRMLALTMSREPDLDVLRTIPNLVAVRRGKNFTQPVPWPDLNELAERDPLREEWSRAMRE